MDNNQKGFARWWIHLNEWVRVGLCALVAGGITCAIVIPIKLNSSGGSGGGGGGGEEKPLVNVSLELSSEDDISHTTLNYLEAVKDKDFVGKINVEATYDKAMPSSISVTCDGTPLELNTSYFYTIEEGLNTAEVKIPAQYVQGEIVISVSLMTSVNITYLPGTIDAGVTTYFDVGGVRELTAVRKARIGEVPVVGLSTPTNLKYEGTEDVYLYSWPDVGEIVSDYTYKYTAQWAPAE